MDFTKLRRYLEGLEAQYKIPSWECRVISNGHIVLDEKSESYNKDRNKYFIYSMTKLVTCVAAMRLVEKGKLYLDDMVEKYLPEFSEMRVKKGKGNAEAKNKMTIRHLLSMQGGFNYDVEQADLIAAVKENSNASTRDIVNVLSKRFLEFEPGEQFEYSLCYDVLGAVIEIASGKRFGEYLKQEIFEPLGMKDTTFKVTDVLQREMVPQYRFDKELKKPVEIAPAKNIYIFTSEYESGGAGLISTFEDYFKFVLALINNGTSPDGYLLLTKESINEIRKDCMTDKMRENYSRYKMWGMAYAFGVRTQVDKSKCLQDVSKDAFEITGAAGSYAFFDLEKKVALLYFQHILGVVEVPEAVHHEIRDLMYEGFRS